MLTLHSTKLSAIRDNDESETLAENFAYLLDHALLPQELRVKPPLSWTISDVSSWLEALNLHPSSFVREKIDGYSLFDLTEGDLQNSSLLPSLGDRKKFLRARVYVSSAFNVTSQKDLYEMLSKKQVWIVEQERRKQDTLDERGGGEEHDGPVKKTTVTNMPTWQQKMFKRQRNISGGVTIAIEILLNFLPKVHPAAHLVSFRSNLCLITGLVWHVFMNLTDNYNPLNPPLSIFYI